MPELIKRLEDTDPGVRLQAAGALSNLDTAAAEWMAAVRTTLRDGDEETRTRARDLLKRAGTGGIQSAAYQGQADVVTGLLDGGVDADALDKKKRTALHWAAQADKPEVAKVLLARGASPALLDEDRNLPLHLAAIAGSVEVTGLLLAKKADPNVSDRQQLTPLHLAAGKGSRPVVEALLAAGANPRAKGRSGETPLHMAALAGKTDVVQLLLAKGLDINLADDKGQGPVFYAAGGGHTDLVKMLLDRKALARGTGDMRIVAGTPLHDAARGGHVATMELLIARGVPLGAEEFGRTAFQVAANEGQVDALKLLLSKGVKVDGIVPQSHEETALHFAAFQAHLAAARLLIDSGANVNAVDSGRGRTPLHQVVSNGSLNDERRAILVLLLDKGAKVDVRDKEGKTPLALALEYPNEGAVKLLRERGAKE